MIAIAFPLLGLLMQASSPQAGAPAPQPGVTVQRTSEMPDLGPMLIYKEGPKYTDEARQHNIEGDVVLRAYVGVDGKLQDIAVVHSLGYGLDEKAVECVQSWRFQPGRKNWVPYATSANIEVSFRLHPEEPFQPGGNSAMRMYSDPGGAFTFAYPKSFHLREDIGGMLSQGCIACLSYDRNLYPHSNFAGAEFWVDIPKDPAKPDGDSPEPITTESDCVSFRGLEGVKRPPPEMIGGATFARVTWGGAATGTESDVELFRAFHDGKCYELGTEISVIGAYDPEDYASGRVKRFTQSDEEHVRRDLQLVLHTFLFHDSAERF